MRKPTFYICENKDADQLRGNREADQRLCFRNKDITIPLLSKSDLKILQPSSVAVQTGFVGPGRKPKRWFSHDAAHLLFLFVGFYWSTLSMCFRYNYSKRFIIIKI